jgi:hypothetical protein
LFFGGSLYPKIILLSYSIFKSKNKMKKIKLIAVLIMFLSACQKDANDVNPVITGEASTSNANMGRTPASRPFSANFYATANANSPNPPTACSGDLPGFAAPDFLLSGTATHLGQISSQLSSLHHVSCDLSFATMLLTTSVSVELTAADGSVIHCTGNDVVNVASLLTQTGTTGTITGTWTITGGTGRFTGASGSFTISGIVDFVTNSFNCQCAGTISY